MFYNVKEGKVNVGDSHIEYIAFGKGSKNLVLIPGLNVKDIKGSGLPLAHMYRQFTKDYRVYVIDRRYDVPIGYSIWDMANDTVAVLKELGIKRTSIIGVSQGGMIAQAIALEHQDMVEKLVLGVTASRPNDMLEKCIKRWIRYTLEEDYESLNKDSIKSLYTKAYIKRNNVMIPIVAKMTKPRDNQRFVLLSRSILNFDCYDRLEEIKCPVFVIGAKLDKVVTAVASLDISEKLGCPIYIYDEYGHAAYDEASDFNTVIYNFLKDKNPKQSKLITRDDLLKASLDLEEEE